MPVVYEVGYDAAYVTITNTWDRARRLCDAVCGALTAAGIVYRFSDDQPWTDAASLSGFLDTSCGTMYVSVDDEHVERATAIARKAAGAAPPD